jgi:hypothetical protein
LYILTNKSFIWNLTFHGIFQVRALRQKAGGRRQEAGEGENDII